MTIDRTFLTSPTGQIVLVAAVLLLGVLAVRSQRKTSEAPVPGAKPAPASLLPRTIVREGARFSPPRPTKPSEPAPAQPIATPAIPGADLPLGLFTAPTVAPALAAAPSAPYGRLVPCTTVLTLESNRLDTPIIGLVTEPVWHAGRCVIPAGAEVHGRAVLDRTRERIAAQPQWRIVWRTNDADNGLELAVDGILLERGNESAGGMSGDLDGSAGLRGTVVRSRDNREMRLFAAAFLASATAALQDQRPAAGLLGETSVPAATARNAVLAGTGAVLREHIQELRAAIAQDGFYLRVPAGKNFYLYLTQTLDRSMARRSAPAAPNAPSHL